MSNWFASTRVSFMLIFWCCHCWRVWTSPPRFGFTNAQGNLSIKLLNCQAQQPRLRLDKSILVRTLSTRILARRTKRIRSLMADKLHPIDKRHPYLRSTQKSRVFSLLIFLLCIMKSSWQINLNLFFVVHRNVGDNVTFCFFQRLKPLYPWIIVANEQGADLRVVIVALSGQNWGWPAAATFTRKQVSNNISKGRKISSPCECA